MSSLGTKVIEGEEQARTVVMEKHVSLMGMAAATPSDCYQAGIWTQCGQNSTALTPTPSRRRQKPRFPYKISRL